MSNDIDENEYGQPDRIVMIYGNENREWDDVYDTVEEAIKDAEEQWCHLTEKEKKKSHVLVCIVDEDYEEGAIKTILWQNGELVA